MATTHTLRLEDSAGDAVILEDGVGFTTGDGDFIAAHTTSSGGSAVYLDAAALLDLELGIRRARDRIVALEGQAARDLADRRNER